MKYKKLLYITIVSTVAISNSGVWRKSIQELHGTRRVKLIFSYVVPGTHNVSPHLCQIESARPIWPSQGSQYHSQQSNLFLTHHRPVINYVTLKDNLHYYMYSVCHQPHIYNKKPLVMTAEGTIPFFLLPLLPGFWKLILVYCRLPILPCNNDHLGL